ncbi:acetate/propionate family kinase [uncultured Thioclava sp.]|uniref:acetate/propionate family kinase n=1 Tax=uncultured Thioclava sp. TaxID=473858 RepID=UPI0025DD13AB|nr:acetate/propionate family kinase [uncultured Thioclava sp.]
MSEVILTLNAGSTSLKFSLFAVGPDGVDPTPFADGEVDGLGDAPHLKITAASGGIDTALESVNYEAVLARVLDWIETHDSGMTLIGAGHRIVHGGPKFAAPVRLSKAITRKLAALNPLAPLHQPHNLVPVRVLSASHPHLPQVACFDTGFHASNAPLSTRYAIPREMHDAGIRRYGFHGLSYEYIASTLPEYLGAKANGRVVVAHLGGGASMCAIREGRSVASSMGFSAIDGLVMATRSGAIDPGVLLYLMSERGMDEAALSDLLYRRSGLLGVSGISGDMRTLLASPSPEAREAVDLFIYRIGRELGSLVAALGGLDALIFTGGIGEHAAPVREGVCAGAQWLGIRLDETANQTDGPRISDGDSAVPVFVIPTNEDLMIARHTLHVLRPAVVGRAKQ